MSKITVGLVDVGKSTPGPWPLSTAKTSIGICHKIGPFPHRPGLSRENTYACIYDDASSLDHPFAELLANAHLMASAPGLLASLKETRAAAMALISAIVKANCFKEVMRHMPHVYDSYGRRADEAIAKAEPR